MPGEEVLPTEPTTIVEPKPMGMAAEIPSASPQAASTEHGGLFQRILSKLHLSGRSPEPPPAAVAQTPMQPEMPPASPPPVSPPTPGTSTT